MESSGAGSRVASSRLVDDQTIGNQLTNGLARVSVTNLTGLVRVEPDLSLSNAQNAGGKSFLQTKVGPDVSNVLNSIIITSLNKSYHRKHQSLFERLFLVKRSVQKHSTMFLPVLH
jgi:hypothetical protein